MIRIVIPLRPEHAAALAAITKSKDLTRMEDIAIAIGFEDEFSDEIRETANRRRTDPREKKRAYPPTALRARPGEDLPVALEAEFLREAEVLPREPIDLYLGVGIPDPVSGRLDDEPLFIAKATLELGGVGSAADPRSRTIEVLVTHYTFFPTSQNDGVSNLLSTATSRLGVDLKNDVASAEQNLRSAMEEPAERLKQEMGRQGMDLEVDLARIDLTPPRIGATFVAGRPIPGNLPPCEPGKAFPASLLWAQYAERLIVIEAETNQPEATFVLCADQPVSFRCLVDENPRDFEEFFFADCTSPLRITNLELGMHEILFFAFDANGNARQEPVIAYLEVVSPDVKLPSPPAALQAEPFDGKVILKWDPAIGATSYNVHYGTGPDLLDAQISSKSFIEGLARSDEEREKLLLYGGFITGLTVDHLTNDNLYYFSVASVDANGIEGSLSTAVKSTPKKDTIPPVFDGHAWAVPLSDTHIQLVWDQATDEESAPEAMVYRICQSTLAGECTSRFTATYTTDPGMRVFQVTGLLPNTTYYFVVRAVDQAGNEDSNTNERSAKTPPPPPPTAKLLFQINGFSENDGIGLTAAGAGDINGDGKPDIIVGIPAADPAGLTDAGSALVYSGVDGTLIQRVDGGIAGDHCGKHVAAAGDLNADGRDDFMAIRCKKVQLAVFSGIDGARIFPPQLGKSAVGVTAPVGDVNGDGKTDFAVGDRDLAPGGSLSYGKVTVYSGNDGSVIYQLQAEDATSSYGQALSAAGDVNNDGRADFIVGSYLSGKSAGSAYVYSGADGKKVYSLGGGGENSFFGYSVAAGGDSNKDGRAFFFIGAYGRRSVYAYNHAQGAELWVVQRQGDEPFGYSVSATRDMDGDGKADVVVGAAGTNSCGTGLTGSAHVYSGMDGKLLLSEFGRASGDEFGSVVAGIGDVNGDGKGDFLVVARCTDPGGLRDAGSVFVFASP